MASSTQFVPADAASFWSTYLAESEPCQFPRFGSGLNGPKRPMSLRVNVEQQQKLQSLSVSDEVSLPSLLRTAWGLLLRCYTGQDDVCFGYQESGASNLATGEPASSGTSPVTSVARLILDETMSLAKTLENSRGEYVSAAPYQSSVPSNAIKNSERQLFDTAVVLRAFSNTAVSTNNTTLHRPTNVLLPEEYKIRLLVKSLNGNVSLFMEWWSSQLSVAQANGIACTLDNIITGLLINSDVTIGNLDYLSKRNMQQILSWNNTPLDKVERCIHEVIHDQGCLRPDSQAVCAWDGNFSYRELDEISDQLANQLVQLGVGPEIRVPLCFEKSKWTIVAMLGVMKAGGAFVPLDPSHPVPRLQGLVRSVDAKVVLCSRRHVELLATISDTVLPVDADALSEPRIQYVDRPNQVTSQNAAYLIFTSGSTGEPKGTVIEHSAYCSSAKAHTPRLHINEKSRVFQFAAHTFDSSLCESLTPLMCGACVCIPSEEDRLNNVIGAINDLRVNHATLTPSFIGFIDPSAVPGLGTLILAGEAMSQGHVETWSKIKLVNGYGPTESSVSAVINSHVTTETDCKDIGFPVGVHCWIADPSNHDRLVPVGCIGELLLEGPTLARGYLNNPEKTNDSFIFDPAWSRRDDGSPQHRRFYKTGDLVRYNSEQGSMSYVGRKDTQVKFHGQRIELGEIEHHLSANPNTKHGLVLLPKLGPCKQRLVAIVSLSDSLRRDTAQSGAVLKLVEGTAKDSQVEEIRERMSARLPAYMVPTTWICMEALPMLTSGKLDRKSLARWVEGMSSEVYLRITQRADSEEKAMAPASEIENKLRQIWSRILNIPLNQIGLDRGFLSLGGDSITAMTCMNQAKKIGLGLTVQEILRCKSLQQLATCVKAVETATVHQEVLNEPFELAPIQQLHFVARSEREGHFNQSFFLRLARKVQEKDLRTAIEMLIDRHSMLRARFSQTGGVWQQRITQDSKSSHSFRTHKVYNREQVKSGIANSQCSLNAQYGPVFAADLFDVNGEEQLLFMVGHHLVIDLVSWRVILEDLEEILEDPRAVTTVQRSLPFQTWCRLQTEHCQDLSAADVLPVEDVPAGDFAYWGMESKPNNYGDVACEGFEVDPTTTSLLLTECHQSLRTETIDILLSALLFSFAQVFTDRTIPAIFNEGHGREPPSSDIDISRTVGWFTVVYPVFVAMTGTNDIVDTVKRIKDLRHRVPAKGRPYFASRFLSSHGRDKFSYHFPMEMSFNYLGQYQQLEREGALLQPAEAMAGEAHVGGGTADFAHTTPRFGLFEISAVIARGKLRFSFTFNRYMKHQQKIRQWISQCEQTILDASRQLLRIPAQATLSDFPLLSLTEDTLKTMQTEKLPQIGVHSMDDIEDAYPCSPMQQGLLLSRTKDAAYYAVHGTYEVKPRSEQLVDAQKLADSWQQVVAHHSALRTVFVEGLSSEGLYDQVVLKHSTTTPVHVQCDSEQDVLVAMDKLAVMTYNDGKPPHRFVICQTSSGKVFCRLELSHTIMDGASMSIIFRDLGQAYANQLRGHLRPLYSNFIAYLQKQPSEAGITYWKSYLSGLEPCHFPILNDGISAVKELHSLRLDFKELRRLQDFCDTNGLTLSNAFHAAWSLTLRCYTGSEDVCFGYLTSERDAAIPGAEAAVGPFINMLVCRANMLGSILLKEVLEQAQRDYMNSLPYKHTSLADVQHALRLAGTPMFNTCLSYRKLPSTRTVDSNPITFSEHAPIHDPTEYPISINVEASEEDAAIDLDYWTDSISDGQAANVASTFMHSLRNIIHNSTLPIGHIDHVGDDLKEQMWAWNSRMPETIPECVHWVVEKQIKLRPHAEAICAWDGKFTYAQLDDLSNRLAHYLVDLGVAPEVLVPTCFDKSAWAVISMLAVLKAGGACVPLDATHPKNALETRVVDTGAHVVLASAQRAQMFEDMVPYVVVVSPSLLDQLPAATVAACTHIQPTNPSFVIFTSGSTGKPKGVVLEHQALVTSAEAHGTALGIGPQTRCLQFAAYTFDNSIEEMFTTLQRGGCVCVPSENDRFNHLAKAINELDANFMDLTPTVATFLQPSDVPKIKALAVGGEAMTKEVLEIWGNAVPLHNQYGPSECSINATHNGNAGATEDVSNLGRSVGSVSWIVDPLDHNRLVPIGCEGELLIEGPILARGYLNDPEKTSKSFVGNPEWASHDPYGSNRGARRMYKTGDLVRYNSDGTLSYLGRKDTQIKLNGQRIELGEIEHHVKANLSSGAQSAVELVSTAGKTKALAAFIYLPSSLASGDEENMILPMSQSFEAAAKALESSVSNRIASYMVPSMYIPVSRMPMTSSLKIDRRTLRTMASYLSESQAATYRLSGKSGRAPSTKMEKDLQQLWAAVLSVSIDSIGADDSFFGHGGDSIRAMRFVKAARAKGILLTVANIFRTPKLSELARGAAVVSGSAPEDAVQSPVKPFTLLGKDMSVQDLKEEVASICNVDIGSVEDIYPCAPLQEGAIALSSRQPGAYVAMSTFQLPKDINIPRFRKAWQEVADTEAVLRTRIVFTKSRGFLQVVVQEPLTWNSVVDVQSIPDTDRHLPLQDGGILCRYTIVGENTPTPLFIWTAHHALYDGWSLPILLSKVEARYQAPQSPIADLAPSYSRFIEYLCSIDPVESDKFWQTRLSESTAPKFPQLPHPGYEVQATSQAAHTVRFSIPAGIGLTTASLLRAAWALVISIYSYSDDVVFGEVLTGRDVPVPGIDNMVGPTVASIPTRLCINREMTVAQFLEDMHKQLSAAMPYQFAGLQRIRGLSPEAAVTCDLQNGLVINYGNDEPTGRLWNMVKDGTIGTNFYTFPLNMSCTVSDDNLEIGAIYDQNVIPTWQVSRMLYQFGTILDRLTSREGIHEKVGEMDILTPQDHTRIEDWNRSPLQPVDKCIHQAFRERVISQPNSIAVCSWDATFTYKELDQLSTSLAYHLADLGVGPNSQNFVPLCFEKSAFTIVAMLSVLKAGSAFVPLDPTHPIARLQQITSDVGAGLVLCSPRHQPTCEAFAAQTLAVDLETLKQLPLGRGTQTFSAPNSAAYVIFTSGTTGKPKGTLIEHSAFCSGAAAHAPAMLMTPTSRVLQFSSYTFDVSLTEILTTLIIGGTVCVPNEFDRINNVATVMEQMEVNIALLTPSFAQFIKPSEVPHLRTLILAGEAMSESHVSTWAGKVNLVNGYGPTECSVIATVNSAMTPASNPANIGTGLDRCWVVDPRNHHRLAPIGSVGELLVEGPTLARGYLNNETKTAEVFIRNPKWATAGQYPGLPTTGRRMYKTGDLVRVCSDVTGEMIVLGRKDTQAKVNGQRLELDEIEHHLNADNAVRHVLVALPKSGCCAKRLVAVLSLQELAPPPAGSQQLQVVLSKAASSILSEVQARLRDRLPAYMIPSKWVVFQKLPLLASGKRDRRQMIDFIENMSDDIHDKISAVETNEASNKPSETSGTERQLQLIWAHVLNRTPERIGLNQSFLHLGGDSISAMQVMARCRSEGIGITVPDIIKSKSIADLASRVSLPEQITHEGEDAHEFDLSPIQQFYFTCVGSNVAQFNQSVLLRLARKVTSEEVTRAVNALVKAHSMLRARFRKDGTGNWRQRITSDVPGSYRFKAHNIMTEARIKTRVEDSQKCLDIQKGPVLAVDLFDIKNGDVQFFITAHHLVIDVVSWRIILQDLEDFFGSGKVIPRGSLPFQSWCRLQSTNAQHQNKKVVLPHCEAAAADLDYWGMTDKPNLYGDTLSEAIEINSKTTSEILGGCHDSLKTDTVDVLLAVLLHAYRNAFSDRLTPPTIYNEGHGREPWEAKLDVSRTVGWFTTLCPVYLPRESIRDDDLINAIRWVKDYRRRLPGKGRSYFAYRLLTAEGKDQFGDHWPMEIAFNYLGQMQQLERKDAFLQPINGGQSVNTLSDIGNSVPRFALIEISAVVSEGRMRLSFDYNKQMKHQPSITKWMNECRYLLEEAPRKLFQHKAERTLSDFPLLPLTYHGSEELVQRLQEIKLSSLEDIQDVYPCSPMQRGLILSQMKDSERYAYQSIFEVRCSQKGHLVDIDRLVRAWQAVVQRHATLRTVFIDSVGQDGLMDQVVIKNVEGRIANLECRDSDVQDALAGLRPLDYSDKVPPHRLAVCKTLTGRVFCKLDMSHVISDGSSAPILLHDLADAYAGSIPAAGSTPLYSDYIAYLQAQPRDESIGYWKQYLADVEPCLFPSVNDGATDPKNALGSHVLSLKQASKLEGFCTDTGVTMSTVLQLVWALVLRCYTGSDEVCFGYLASGRDMPVKNIESAVGAFINMLVCRINLTDDLDLGEALDKLQLDSVSNMAHQGCSLAEVQHELNLSGTALFNTVFSYLKRAGAAEEAESMLQYDSVGGRDPSEYSIAINAEAEDSSVWVHFSYWTHILSDSQAKHLAATFEQILDDLIRSPQEERTVGDMDLLGEYSCQEIRNWNSSLPCAVDKCIHEIIEQQALCRPLPTPAICGWDANFTYAELETVTTRLARHLIGLGVAPEMYVPLCFEKSAWTIVAQLAVLKAGGAFCNIDPSHPESRLRDLVDVLGAKLVLCSPKYTEKISRIAKMSFTVDKKAISQLSHLPMTSPLSRAKPSDPAYVIFTSGTTGSPKAIVVEHAAYCTSAVAHSEAMLIRSDSRSFQFASYTFDASMLEILSTLIVGGCVCVPSDHDRMNDIAGAIRKMGVTWSFLTPSVVAVLDPRSVSSLKTLVVGGEAMPPGLIDKWSNTCAVINGYGPTECSAICSTSTKVDERGQKVNNDRSNIGKAVGGRGWVVDHRNYNRLVPVGAVGELVVEGRLVARGYLNNEKKTSEVFIQDPEWTGHPRLGGVSFGHPQQRMYRTGDLVRYNSDGSYSYISRKDTQIKLNGQRIELGEIEYQCRQNLPEQAEAAVELVVPASRVATKALAVFFSLRVQEGENNSTSSSDALLLPMDDMLCSVAKDLKSGLGGVLPTYMIPQIFVPVSRMPWTTSGKLDRRRLRQSVEALSKEATAPYRLAVSGAKRNPTTAMEKKLQELWEKVMKLAPGSVGAEDNFFNLGGDSLAAISLVGAARSQSIALTVLSIFQKPKLTDMAKTCQVLKKESQPDLKPFALLQSSQPVADTLWELSDQCRIRQELIHDVYPCSSLQEGLITLTIKQPGAYVNRNVFKLPKDVDIDRFKSAWQKTVDDTDTLRTRIVHTTTGTFLQVVVREEPIIWQTAYNLQDVTANIPHLPAENGGPLTKYTIVSASNSGDRYLVWDIHHAIYDGWSLPLVLKRVEDFYRSGAASGIQPSYAKFIQYLQKTDIKASELFWKSHLTGVSSMHFPQVPHSAANERPSFKAAFHRVEFGRTVTSPDITVPCLIRAAWAIVLAAYTGVEDVVFGETLSGRNIDVPCISDLVGPTFTTIPTRIQLDRSSSIPQFLRKIQELSTELIPHQHLGLQRIRRLNDDAAVACDFQNLLSIQAAEESIEDGFWNFESGIWADNFYTHPLALECKIVDAAIEVSVGHNENVLSVWQVQRILYQFEAVLKQLRTASKNSSTMLCEIEVFSPEDKETVVGWNGNTPHTINECIHDIFKQKAFAQPYSQAVCAWDDNLTYRELNDYASRLAAHLVTLGVSSEHLVPICLHRSAWTVVAMLGILLAGGAFVPLDPSHPVSRHKEILEETEANLVLCSPEYSTRYAGVATTPISVDKNFIRHLPPVQRPGELSCRASSNNAAYLIFTSGSTGRAKGVVVEHGAFCSSSAAFAKELLMKSDSRVFHFASLTFDAALAETLSTLTVGGCICIPSAEERTKDIAGAMSRMDVNWSAFTPSVVNLIEPSSVPSLRTLVCAGEAMLTETVTKWAKHVNLINAYGPTEASIVVTVNPKLLNDSDPSVIGRATSNVLAWILDANDHNKLAPVGGFGELAVSGPILAREYLKNPQKTAEAFIENPAWASRFKTGPRRIYKTGDLVKYTPSGALEFIGRKDNQVKVNGQRLELGEIENRLDADPSIRHVLIVMPKSGLCNKRLVAVLSLNSLSVDNASVSSGSCELVRETQVDTARKELSNIRNRLSELLPPYMVPQIWAVVNTVPMLVSGKLDRKQVATWVSKLDEKTYKRIMATEDGGEAVTEATGTAKVLQEVCARVLNLPLEKLNVNQSFLSLGGDSITAMGVMSRCRKEGINLSLKDVLQCKSIIQLAQRVGFSTESTQEEEKVGEPFDLSPIQQMYFDSATRYQGQARFNQSFSLRISRQTQPDTVKRALESIVDQHSMLRARFARNREGGWQQHITKDVSSSYRYRVHYMNTTKEVPAMVADTQASLHIEHGPVFAADFFDVRGEGQTIFLAAHHLCIDMVSWRIILQDLQEFLEAGSLGVEKPLSFQTWCSMQAQHTQHMNSDNLLPFHVTPTDLSYWGMDGQPNTYSQTELESFTMDASLTELALGDCHKALNTEPVDLFLSTVVHSFTCIFNDRAAPTLYNENHGREAAWNSTIDLSRTVGWFTTLCPLVVPVKHGGKSQDDVVDTLRQTKDIRRKIPENGRPYFAHRFLSPKRRFKSGDSGVPMEIVFNYLGRMQQLERDDSLLQQIDFANNEEDAKAIADIGPDTARLALFEISAIVMEGKLQFTFMYNSNLRRAQDVRRWIHECKRTLEETVSRLAYMPVEPTLSDYPLMPMTYDGLRKLIKDVFPKKVGVRHHSQVEDVYPCSPLQEGLLISQLRDPSTYMFYSIFEVRHAQPGVRLNARKMGMAWQKVVDRHAALRTTFIDSVHRDGVFDQVVVKNVDSGVLYIQCEDEDAVAKLNAIPIQKTNHKKQPQLPHQLTVCTTSTGRLLIKAVINHVVIDGGSISVLLDDLAAAYEDRLQDGPGPLYSNYIRYIRSQTAHSDTQFWKRYLEGIKPCYFPQLNVNSASAKRLSSVEIKFDRYSELQQLAEKTKVTMASIMHAAWALVLRKYTGSEDVCFGYLSAGRDAPVEDIQHTIGAFINMLCCRVKTSPSAALSDVFRTVHEEYLESIPFQRCSLAQVQHDLGLAGETLYNTSLSVQNHSSADDRPEESIVFEMEEAHDPSEYTITVNVETGRGQEGVILRYWSNLVSDEQAAQVASTMGDILNNFLSRSGDSIAELNRHMENRENHVVTRPRLSLTTTVESGWDNSVPQPLPRAIPDSVQQPAPWLFPELPRPQVQRTVQFPIQQTVMDDNAALKQIVNDCVQQIIEQMFKTGAVATQSAEAMSNFVTDRNLVTEQLVQANFNSEPNTPLIHKSPIELGSGNQFVDNAVNRQSMAARLSLRGPSAKTEQKLLTIWSSMLGLPKDSISGEDSFFELGGDSITAMQLVGAARDEGLALTVADVFRNPTFEDMAAIIRVASMMSTYLTDTDLQEYNDRNRGVHQAAPVDLYERFSLVKAANIDVFLQSNICPKVGVFKGGIADVLPATDFQSLAITGALLESRWMLNWYYLDGRGALDLRRLKQSCFRLVQAFDILRTVFLPSGDRFLQIVLRKLKPEFQATETDQSLDEFTAMLQQRDRDNGPKLGEPFVQFAVAKQKGSDHHRIFIRMSHAQYDGVCLPKIVGALQCGYQGEPISSTPSFANYVRASAGTVTSDHYQHWKSLLKGSSMTEIVRRNGPNYRRSAGATTSLQKKIHMPSVAHGSVTTATIVKAAWAYVLAQLTACSDIVFGHTISGRNAAVQGVENIIGPCLNVVPVRVQFKPYWTVLDLLRHVQDQQVANMPYEALGFREIIKRCTEWPDWTNFTTAVQHQNIDRPGSEIQLGQNMYRLGVVGAEEDFGDFSIVSTPQENTDTVEIALSFSLNGAITTAFAQKVLNMLCDCAESFSANPSTTILSPSEIHCLSPQIIDDITVASDDLFQSTHLHGLSRAELLVLSDILSRGWRQVLREGSGDCIPLHLESSFFELGGDIMGLAQVAWLLEQEGFKVRVEDLIDHPTLLGQIAVLVMHNSRMAAKNPELEAQLQSSTTLMSPRTPILAEREPVPLQKLGRTNTFAKAMGLARSLVKKNTRPTYGQMPA